jgi:hypothetical protein
VAISEWMLRKMCKPKRQEMREEWRKLRIEELHNLNSTPNIIINF